MARLQPRRIRRPSHIDLEFRGGNVSAPMRVHLMPTTIEKARTVAVLRMPFNLIKVVS
jgi:hypothetical protein